jgi:aspartate/methionine/tyrosine aminotransferase
MNAPSELAAALNEDLLAGAPALRAALSPLGERAYFPREIPFQATEARGALRNATIGQITDGRGNVLAPPALSERLAGLAPADKNVALLYSPIEGLAELRDRWTEWQRRDASSAPAATRPIVTAGISHAIALAADLFAAADRDVAVPGPFWGNYRQIFGTRYGARIVTAPLLEGDGLDTEVFERLLGDGNAPAIAVINFPSNPGGYSPTASERERLVASLCRVASRRVVVALCDDAYHGLVYDPNIPESSLFWDLASAHQNLVAVKADGVTKELAFFGGRVGFLTFGIPPGTAAALAIEEKVKGLIRTSIGSPVAASQAIVLAALRDETLHQQVASTRALLAERYAVLREALAGLSPGSLQVRPFNSGCFALLEIDAALGVDAEAVRAGLLEHESTGVIAIDDRYLRLAFCSLAADVLPDLVVRVEREVRRLAAGRRATDQPPVEAPGVPIQPSLLPTAAQDSRA